MNEDGLSNDEKLNILFKNYMNFTSTKSTFNFYEETRLSNNTNIFSDSILANPPPKNPTYVDISSVSEISNYLIFSGLTDISINNNWFNAKTDMSGGFQVDSKSDDSRTVLRLTKIKLDYLGSGTAAFVCTDNNGVNILQNLIPSNYSTNGYSLFLEYKINNELKSVGWLASRTELSGTGFVGQTVKFGGALFDSKNGLVTFYDVENNDPYAAFTNAEFYLTATKYIGSKGSGTSSSMRLNTIVDVSNNYYLTFSGKKEGDDCSLNTNDDLYYDPSSGTLFVERIQIAGVSGTAENVLTIGDQLIGGNKTFSENLIIHGSLIVTGTVGAYTVTNHSISDQLIELGSGRIGQAIGDTGIVIERGDDSNLFIGWDESQDKFIMGTTDAIGTSTGDLNITKSALVVDICGTVSSIANHTTDQLIEGSNNLYFTNARAQQANDSRISDLSSEVIDLSTNYYINKTNTDATISDLSTSHYDLSTNYYVNKTNTDATISDLSTSHYDLSLIHI